MKHPKPTPSETKPTPLVPILVIITVVAIAAVLIGMSFQQRTIATQRQTIHDLTCHVEGLQTALQEAKWQRDTWSRLACCQIGIGFTNTPLYYPKFLLKD